MAASLGPCCQPFQAGQLMNLLLLNDRKKRNLIGSQQWEGCFWLRAPRSLGPCENSDPRWARAADRQGTIPLRLRTHRNRKSFLRSVSEIQLPSSRFRLLRPLTSQLPPTCPSTRGHLENNTGVKYNSLTKFSRLRAGVYGWKKGQIV